MSTANTPAPVLGKRVVIDAGRLWGGGLATVVVAALVPFTLGGSLEGKICAAAINLVIGLCIATLLSAVLSPTVVAAERSWQQP